MPPVLRAVSVIGLILLAAAGLTPVRAGNLDVQPTTIHLSPSKPTGVMMLTNRSDQETSFQLRTLGWVQREGKNVLEPTQAILASPGIFTLGPGEQQLIRLHHRGAPAQAGETAFRVLLDELPKRVPQAGVLSVLLQLSLPVFVRSGNDLAPRLSVHPARAGDNLRIRVHNQGNLTAKLGKAAFTTFRGHEHAVEELRYVLPGSYVDYSVPQGVAGPMRVDLLTEDGWQHFSVEG